MYMTYVVHCIYIKNKDLTATKPSVYLCFVIIKQAILTMSVVRMKLPTVKIFWTAIIENQVFTV